jgi:hypothetical protein
MSNLQMTAYLRQASVESFPVPPTVTSAYRTRVPQCPQSIQRLVKPIQAWLEHVEVKDAEAARLLYKIIPGQCPFERDVTLFGRTLFHIPPLCKLNPFYEQLVAIRFRAMCYLVDECGASLDNLD